ncbi:MAG: hypothetical protein A2736_01815 [Candidatus Yanofskybacteria bacterium RIFCSPHIGHO2_01_FULL_41_27]|uniref:Uncharacterized protein n=3 Tax=Parcubacteria group TaxID=1794811 RepID=A0A0G1M5V6_9BACT|nr:MAG: hypothetical protein UX06_C0038G0003 [Candidatus Giovannonibacteria bacterium GW2011_GWA2_45_21]KKU15806.1 MAG: hypothetical protein UX24_C0030G0006 [Candidatus Giovannonibacteria bacterium GW2011_GWB1_45_9b]OGM99532.1 MAG: hypothetical protein A2736_01815 [Candidatus Yanofskybacteria bacterium RIFCSPHIGHO2_01_FULL_41_27]OGN21782.1 MAG: hypothetical protein A3B00_02915 [Candidatus Yanofskybacteria bacterium RIFCSPLOWO2_01_FULL_41_33]
MEKSKSIKTVNPRAKKETAKKQEKPKMSLSQHEAILRDESIAAKRFEMLFGDLKKIPSARIPKTDGASPFEIQVKDVNAPVVHIINSPLIGTLEPADESLDILRNALRLAEGQKSDAVLITGNLIYCLVEKYGKQRPYRTQVVGLPMDPKIIESSYPKAVLEKMGPLATRIKDGKVVFLTLKIYLDLIFKLVREKFIDKSGQPIFKGKVYVTLGEIEESIAMHYANEALRAEVFREKAFAHKQISLLRVELSGARKDGDKQAEEKLLEAINDWQIYSRVLVLMGNIAPGHINERRQEMINYLVYRIESDIPNAKVIGTGDTYVRIGKQIVSIVSDKTTESIRGGLAGRLRKKIYNYIKAHPGEKIPAVVLGGGLNPWGVGLYASYRVRRCKEPLDDVRMAEIIQLLPCIDSHLYREVVRRMLKAKDRVARLASTTNFQSGIQTLRFFEPAPIPRFDWYTSEFLTNREIFADEKTFENFINNNDPRAKMIYSYKEGCTHYGAVFVARYDSPDDKNGRYIKYHNQVLFETFVRDNVPIHLYQNDGDIQHWLNYQAYKEVDNHLKDPEDLLAELTKIENNKKLSAQERAKAIKIQSLLNSIRTGVIQPEEQIEVWGKATAPYGVFFKNVIERARMAGVKMTGNLNYIAIGQGNHNEHSFKGNTDIRFSEAKLTRKELLFILMRAGYNPPDLEERIAACQMSGVGMANGTFLVSSLGQKAYEYCIFMKHKHGSSKTEDNMRMMITNFSHRGTTDDYEEGRLTINLGGDDHLGGHAVTRSAFHVKTGGQMFNGPFGLKFDFPKQNLFSAVWGVAAGGPAWGPCVIVRFDFRITRKLATYQITIPPKLFPNPV